MGESSGLSAVEVVEKWLRANDEGDLAAARDVFADDLVFEDPLDSMKGADPFLEAMQKIRTAGILRGFTDVRLVGDGAVVMATLGMDTVAGSIPAAHAYTVQGGRITELRTYFDPRPLLPPA